jgi:hypothetical protein
MSQEIIVLEGEDQTHAYSLMMLRHRLHLETIGIKFKGRPTSVYIRKILKSKTMNKNHLLAEYEDWMVMKGYNINRYTETVKLTQRQEEKDEIQNHIRRQTL